MKHHLEKKLEKTTRDTIVTLIFSIVLLGGVAISILFDLRKTAADNLATYQMLAEEEKVFFKNFEEQLIKSEQNDFALVYNSLDFVPPEIFRVCKDRFVAEWYFKKSDDTVILVFSHSFQQENSLLKYECRPATPWGVSVADKLDFAKRTTFVRANDPGWCEIAHQFNRKTTQVSVGKSE